ETSAISVDGAHYLLGGVLTVTVTLKDVAGNSVSGEEGKLATAVKVPNAELKGVWADKGDGVYVATYTATVIGDNLKAILTLNGWGQPRESGVYRVVLDVITGIAGIQVNGHQFNAGAGFPTTGFNGAKFVLELKEGRAFDYTWKASVPWVVVADNGEVRFTGWGSGGRVTLIGIAKNGMGYVQYSFQLKRWFSAVKPGAVTWRNANMTCTLPTLEQLTSGTGTRSVGSLWGEWGDIEKFNGFYAYGFWTSERSDSLENHHVVVGREDGSRYITPDDDGVTNGAMCLQNL
ncbi:TPA: hypothetical protein SMF39_004390, partial [Serratia marcescens]|nr:hypothetical protein [Serratia marcescens]